MSKIIALEEAVNKVNDGDFLLVGGFLAVGSPLKIIDKLVEKGVKDLTLACNDTSFVDKGVGKMVLNKQFKKIYASHIGTNKETGRQMNENETEVVLVPQGTLAEQIRAAGYGLGGVLTATGLGTKVEEGKQVVEVDDKKFLLEKPIHGDVALIYANVADKYGNLKFHGSTQNFNNVMAAAAKITIVEADEIVDCLNPDEVHVPGVFVNYIVDGGAL